MTQETPKDEAADGDGTSSRLADWRAATARRVSSLANLVRWQAHWRLPTLIACPAQFDASAFTLHDDNENSETRAPDNIDLRVPMVWGVEMFGPAEIDCLYRSLARLGWGSVGVSSASDAAAQWIRRQRSYGSFGWLNVGEVVRPEKRGESMFISNYAPFPAEVDSLRVRIFQVSQACTAVLVGFHLREDVSLSHQRELMKDRTTTCRSAYGSRTLSIDTPHTQKRLSIGSTRASMQCMIAEWFRQHLPGYFSGLNRPTALPVMELLTSREGDLFGVDPNTAMSALGWRRLLANAPTHSLWTSKTAAGLQLTLDRRDDEADDFCATAAIDNETFTKGNLRDFGGTGERALLFRADEMLGPVMLHVSTIQYLREQLRELSATREALRVAARSRRGVLRTIDEIRCFFDRTIGLPVVARELAKKSEHAGWFRRDCWGFQAPAWTTKEQMRDLGDELCGAIRYLSSRLVEEDIAMREHLEQLSAVLSVKESIRTQRRMELLTVVAVLVGAASLVVAFASVNHLFQKLELLREILSSLIGGTDKS